MRVIKVNPSSFFDFRKLYPKEELDKIIPTSILEENTFSVEELNQSMVAYIRNDVYISTVSKLLEIISSIYENTVIEHNGFQLVIISKDIIHGTDLREAIKDYAVFEIDSLSYSHIKDNISLHKAIKQIGKDSIIKHIENGVLIPDTTSCQISPEAVIEAGTIIKPNSTIVGHSVIAKDCVIGPDSTIETSVLGERTKIVNNTRIFESILGEDITVQNSTVLNSKIGNFTTVGPYAYIRPNSLIGSKVKIGDFVEVKNSTIGNGTKSSHLAYIGDSDVGENVNIGCGVVFVNYDGKNKYRSTIEKNSFIGCNANLVSPVHVGQGAFIAAGSTITDDVEENQLAIARERQINKDNWSLKKKN